MLCDLLLPPHLRDLLWNAGAYVFSIPLLDRGCPTLALLDAVPEDVMVLMEPPSIDARIQNQYGLLSVMNGARTSHDRFLRSVAPRYPGLVKRVVIRAEGKPAIRDMLDLNNITERMLFPGLPGLCDWLRRYYGPA